MADITVDIFFAVGKKRPDLKKNDVKKKNWER